MIEIDSVELSFMPGRTYRTCLSGYTAGKCNRMNFAQLAWPLILQYTDHQGTAQQISVQSAFEQLLEGWVRDGSTSNQQADVVFHLADSHQGIVYAIKHPTQNEEHRLR